MGNLAINGGKPVYPSNAVMGIPWPPVSEETAERIKELYLSRAWSFNSETEQAFERAFSEYHDAKHGIFMANGTVTLECALLALGVGPGDEVIVPGLTWIATAMAVHYVGATVVFADVEADTFCLDPASVEERITPKTKAIIPVHLYGSMADLEKLLAIAKKHNLFVIEDCAHMQGGKWAGKGAGSWGDVGSFSFQQSKTLAAGESGICITNDDRLALRIYRAKHIGYPPASQQGQAATAPDEDLICHNYRGLAIPARILLDQLPGLDALLERYAVFAKTFAEQIADVEGVSLQKPGRLATRQGYYSFGIVFSEKVWGKVSCQRLMDAFRAEGAGIGQTYGPVYSHVLFNLKPTDYRNDGCPNVEMLNRFGYRFSHQAMYHLTNAEVFSNILHKLVANIKELEDLA